MFNRIQGQPESYDKKYVTWINEVVAEDLFTALEINTSSEGLWVREHMVSYEKPNVEAINLR